jgi:uncharacterized protein
MLSSLVPARSMTPNDLLKVHLVCAWPERTYSYRADVPVGTTAGQLLEQSRVLERFPALGQPNPKLAVFGRPIELNYVLAPGDRVEVLRALLNDPKESRRKRAAEGTSRKPR